MAFCWTAKASQRSNWDPIELGTNRLHPCDLFAVGGGADPVRQKTRGNERTIAAVLGCGGAPGGGSLPPTVAKDISRRAASTPCRAALCGAHPTAVQEPPGTRIKCEGLFRQGRCGFAPFSAVDRGGICGAGWNCPTSSSSAVFRSSRKYARG
jgi:hypothetical protein